MLGELREHCLDVASPARPLGLAVAAGDVEVLAYGHPGKDTSSLGRVAETEPHAAFGRERRDRLPVETDGARAHRQDADQRAQQRRLAGTVGAQKGDRLAPFDGYADVMQARMRAIGDAETADFEQGGGHAGCPRGGGTARPR